MQIHFIVIMGIFGNQMGQFLTPCIYGLRQEVRELSMSVLIITIL